MLCGDVEEYPGPPTMNFPLHGNLHQGQDIFSDDSRGRQCVPCCLSFFLLTLLKPFSVNIWHESDLDKVLHVGDYIYKYSKSIVQLQNEYLLLNDVPRYICFKDKAFSWSVRKMYKKNYIGEYPLMRLEFAFTASLSLDKYAVFICKGNAIGILSFGKEYLVFVSHCRNEQGFCSSEGTTINKKNDISELIAHVRSLIVSLTSREEPLNEQFELHGIMCIICSQI